MSCGHNCDHRQDQFSHTVVSQARLHRLARLLLLLCCTIFFAPWLIALVRQCVTSMKKRRLGFTLIPGIVPLQEICSSNQITVFKWLLCG